MVTDKDLRKIQIKGCDDSTRIEMELTDAEYELVRKLASESQRVSTYQCMPEILLEGDESFTWPAVEED